MDYSKAQEILDLLYNNNKTMGIGEKKRLYFQYLFYIRKLSYKGNAQAQFDLAGHYEDIGFWGYPNPYFNSKKRIYWYSKSASNNFGEAYNNLANLFEKGEGVPQSLEKALMLYKKGAELGFELCKKNYNTLKKQMKCLVPVPPC